MSVCPNCSQPAIEKFGDGKLLFITSSPNEEEMHYMKPFSGKNKQIFTSALWKCAKIDFNSTASVPLWYHPKSRIKDWTKDACFQVSLELVLDEIGNHDRVVLVGADACRWFTGRGIDNLNGMDVTEFIPEELTDGREFFAICSPSTVFTSQGEFFFALNKLGEWYASSLRS